MALFKTLISGRFFPAGELKLYLSKTQQTRHKKILDPIVVVLLGQFSYPPFEIAVEKING